MHRNLDVTSAMGKFVIFRDEAFEAKFQIF